MKTWSPRPLDEGDSSFRRARIIGGQAHAVKSLKPKQRRHLSQSEMNHATDASPRMHMIKRVVNGLKRHGISDQLI